MRSPGESILRGVADRWTEIEEAEHSTCRIRMMASSSHGRHCSPPRMCYLWVVHEKVVAFIGVVAAQREDKHFVADAQTVDNEL